MRCGPTAIELKHWKLALRYMLPKMGCKHQTLSACNVFQYCKFLKLAGNFMVLVVVGLIGVSWYAVVFENYGPLMLHSGVVVSFFSGLAVLLITFLVFMLLWSYFATVVTDPGRVPPGWHPFADDQEATAALDSVTSYPYAFQQRSGPSRPRYCKKCKHWKPPRAHHCSMSGRCVLKMDHYCIWVVNCVGLLNYKFFLLMIGYGFLACAASVALMLWPFVRLVSGVDSLEGGKHTMTFVVFILDSAFALSLVAFLAMHYGMLRRNMTNIEMYEKHQGGEWEFDRGPLANVKDVMGERPWRWLLPYHTRQEVERQLAQYLVPQLELREEYCGYANGEDKC